MALSKLAQYLSYLTEPDWNEDALLRFVCSKRGVACAVVAVASGLIFVRLACGSPGSVRSTWNSHYDFVVGELLTEA